MLMVGYNWRGAICRSLCLLLLLLTSPYCECHKHGGLPRTRALYNVKKMLFASVIKHTEQVCLKSFRKQLNSFCFLFVSERLFHRLGPPTEKDRSPIMTVLEERGTRSRRCNDERRRRPDGTKVQHSVMLVGADPRSALYTSRHLLNWIRSGTLSQCSRSLSVGVTWSKRVWP